MTLTSQCKNITSVTHLTTKKIPTVLRYYLLSVLPVCFCNNTHVKIKTIYLWTSFKNKITSLYITIDFSFDTVTQTTTIKYIEK